MKMLDSSITEEPQAIWQKCVEALHEDLNEIDIINWIDPLDFQIIDKDVWFGAPNNYIVDHIKENFLDAIQSTLKSLMNEAEVNIRFKIGTCEDLIKPEPALTPRRNNVRGRTSESVVEQAQLELFRLERAGQFQAYPLNPQNEFPTLLTRLPIFVPGRAKKQKTQIDNDFALPFDTSWGNGRKFGPPLTVYDEDTLIALGRLRQNMLIGSPKNMPIEVSKLYSDRGGDVHVHVVYCMMNDIQRMCKTSVGGRNNKLRLESIKRLAATKIEFNKETKDKLGHSGTTIDLLHVKWDVYEEKAVFYIQFSPIMATWLESSYTYIDWHLRLKLSSDVAKAIHRFLSGQPKNYEIMTKKLKATIGHIGPYKHFMTDLRVAMTQLKEENWLNKFDIVGNGRKVPHKLIVSKR